MSLQINAKKCTTKGCLFVHLKATVHLSYSAETSDNSEDYEEQSICNIQDGTSIISDLNEFLTNTFDLFPFRMSVLSMLSIFDDTTLLNFSGFSFSLNMSNLVLLSIFNFLGGDGLVTFTATLNNLCSLLVVCLAYDLASFTMPT